jgi:hypothetical protein
MAEAPATRHGALRRAVKDATRSTADEHVSPLRFRAILDNVVLDLIGTGRRRPPILTGSRHG